jgi:hypothetical protein
MLLKKCFILASGLVETFSDLYALKEHKSMQHTKDKVVCRALGKLSPAGRTLNTKQVYVPR